MLAEVAPRAESDTFLHLYEKAFLELFHAEQEINLRRFQDAAQSLFDSMELSWKALYQLARGKAEERRDHFPNGKTWDSIRTHLPQDVLTQEESEGIAETFASRFEWKNNPEQRQHARYARAHWSESDARSLLEEVRVRFALALRRVMLRLVAHRSAGREGNDWLQVALLDGRVAPTADEVPCCEAPWADHPQAGVEGWHSFLHAQPTVAAVDALALENLGPKYNIAINPFGEMYPDRPVSFGADMFPGFRKILTYIHAGGVFITLAGNPFHYAWDVGSGTRRDTSVAVPNVLVDLHEVKEPVSQRLAVHIVTTTAVKRMLLEGSFGTGVIWDNPPYVTGPVAAQLWQDDRDKELWSLPSDATDYQVYRAIDPSKGGRSVPVARARIHGLEVYPIALLPFGFGALVHVGLSLIPRGDAELAVARDFVSKGILSHYERIVERILVGLA